MGHRRLATCPRACTLASVRPAPLTAHPLPQDLFESSFNDTLNGHGMILHLPTMVIKTIVFYHKFQRAHIIWV